MYEPPQEAVCRFFDMRSMCRMVYYLLLLVLSMIPSSQGVKVFDYREPTISNALNKNSTPFSYPSLKMADVANTSTQARLFNNKYLRW